MLLQTFEIIYFIFYSSSQLLVPFFVSNPITLWTNGHSLFLSMTTCWYKQLLYKLSPATSASKELYTGAAQTLVNLGCFINKSHWNIKTGVTLRFSLNSVALAREVRERSTMGKKMKLSTHPRKFCNHVTVHQPTYRPPERPSVRTTGIPM